MQVAIGLFADVIREAMPYAIVFALGQRIVYYFVWFCVLYTVFGLMRVSIRSLRRILWLLRDILRLRRMI